MRGRNKPNYLRDYKGTDGTTGMAHTQPGPVMVQEAVPAHAPAPTPASGPPVDGANGPALSAHLKPAAEHGSSSNGSGPAPPARTDDDDDESDVDAWDILLEQAEESEPIAAGTLPPCSAQVSS